MEQSKSDELEFESIEGTDVRISKSFVTDAGDMVRVLFPTGGNAIITGDRKSDMPDIVVDNPDAIGQNIAKKGFWGRVWDWIKGKVGGLFGGGSGGVKCSFSVRPILDKAHNVIGFMITYTCTGT